MVNQPKEYLFCKNVQLSERLRTIKYVYLHTLKFNYHFILLSTDLFAEDFICTKYLWPIIHECTRFILPFVIRLRCLWCCFVSFLCLVCLLVYVCFFACAIFYRICIWCEKKICEREKKAYARCTCRDKETGKLIFFLSFLLRCSFWFFWPIDKTDASSLTHCFSASLSFSLAPRSGADLPGWFASVWKIWRD